uniref:Single-stranded DNA-binding protein n=1 Tax=candidate division WOR-3 bacterium TaxID=2052148 RepID=A0A7C4U7L0_UNCW3
MPNYRVPEINRVFLIGRATQDARLQISAKNELPFCMITVANNRRYKNKNTGEWQKETNFISVQITGKIAERLCDRIKKGTLLYIEGIIRTYKKETEGKNITNTLVRATNAQILSTEEEYQQEEEEFAPPIGNDLPPIGDEDEELPF